MGRFTSLNVEKQGFSAPFPLLLVE